MIILISWLAVIQLNLPIFVKHRKRVVYVMLYTINCIYLNVTCGRGATVQKHSLGSKKKKNHL